MEESIPQSLASKAPKIMKKLAILLLWALLLYLFWSQSKGALPSPKELKTLILDFGILAPLVYLLLFITLPLLLFPSVLMAMIGGALFGSMEGFILITTGASLSSSLAFALSRYLGEKTIKKLLARYKVVALLEKNPSFETLLLLRLIPFVPFDALNYLLGLTRVSYARFFTSTLLGILPGALLYAFIGEGALEGEREKLYIALVLLALLALLSLYLKHRFKGKLIVQKEL